MESASNKWCDMCLCGFRLLSIPNNTAECLWTRSSGSCYSEAAASPFENVFVNLDRQECVKVQSSVYFGTEFKDSRLSTLCLSHFLRCGLVGLFSPSKLLSVTEYVDQLFNSGRLCGSGVRSITPDDVVNYCIDLKECLCSPIEGKKLEAADIYWLLFPLDVAVNDEDEMSDTSMVSNSSALVSSLGAQLGKSLLLAADAAVACVDDTKFSKCRSSTKRLKCSLKSDSTAVMNDILVRNVSKSVMNDSSIGRRFIELIKMPIKYEIETAIRKLLEPGHRFDQHEIESRVKSVIIPKLNKLLSVRADMQALDSCLKQDWLYYSAQTKIRHLGGSVPVICKTKPIRSELLFNYIKKNKVYRVNLHLVPTGSTTRNREMCFRADSKLMENMITELGGRDEIIKQLVKPRAHLPPINSVHSLNQLFGQ